MHAGIELHAVEIDQGPPGVPVPHLLDFVDRRRAVWSLKASRHNQWAAVMKGHDRGIPAAGVHQRQRSPGICPIVVD